MNQEIRDAIRIKGVKQWEVCKAMGVSESTFIRWLRSELPEEKKTEILEAVEKARGE